MLASLASGVSTIRGFSSSADCRSTLQCIKSLGINVSANGHSITITGMGLRGYSPISHPVSLDAGNSGSTIRMLSGILAAQDFTSIVDGDASLKRRPMRRIIDPLIRMGARIEARENKYPPLRIDGGPLNAIHLDSKVASAQVKTCILFAGLFADGVTSITEPSQSRDHTEKMLPEFGALLEISDREDGRKIISINGGRELRPVQYAVPGDLSSAAFFIAATAILPGSHLILKGVNLNPTRTAFLEAVKLFGAGIEIQNYSLVHAEPKGDIAVRGRTLKSAMEGILIAGDWIPRLIDEIPILSVMATQVEGRIEIRDANELRIKESDRIRTVVDSLRAMGAEVEEFDDGLAIVGPQKLKGAQIDSAGDHRIAMAFCIAGLIAEGTTEIIGADCAAVSFPEFYSLLAEVAGEGVVEDALKLD